MLKASQNPPTIFPPESSVRQLSGTWWVAHTKARNEKAFAWDLLHQQIAYFLPMSQRITFSGGRKRRVLLPLFSSYVFFCGDAESKQSALATDRLCQVITVREQAELIEDLSAIERVLAGDAKLDPYPFAVVGQQVRISRGPFEGINGIVVRRDNVNRLVLSIDVLGQGASMEIDADILEPAN
jgi:transcription antitermination factor NusG